ncbi:ATP-binding protein [Terrimonas sp. NA20]|uniref:histidine kinase n=1 Tax=Terrimonas ginsenosidimutans TaxID=2908004 RepID=A0ABS9KLT1_9BACT|nr:two-component regulator propeller domain-containing protein [Terrimonas ginsenosidimutans]MCG2613281.1 ATP-binding protein [Terrimonas ginsenosidimutans]
MRKLIQQTAQFLFISIGIAAVTSCNDTPRDVPLAADKLAFPQPVTTALQFADTVQLKWDTIKKGSIRPVVKRLDLDALPSFPYDSTGFKKLSKAPEITRFDFSKLPERSINLDTLTSRPLHFKTIMISPGALKKVSPEWQNTNPTAIADFGAKQGVPIEFASSTFKDRNGLIWIGGRAGLFRYDGVNLQTIIPRENPGITAISEDKKGRIWFAAEGGIAFADLEKSTVGIAYEIGVTPTRMSNLTEDDNGNIWLGNTFGTGIAVIDPENQTYKLVGGSGNFIIDKSTDAIKDQDGNIWAITSGTGISIINQKTGKVRQIRKEHGLATDTVTAIMQAKNGNIWVGLFGFRIDEIDLKSGTIKHYGTANGLPASGTSKIIEDDRGRIWTAGLNGVRILDPVTQQIKWINSKRGFTSEWPIGFAQDNNKRMWVPTISGTHVIDAGGESTMPLGKEQVISLTEDAIGNIWVGSTIGIMLIDAQRNTVRKLDQAHGLAHDFVQSFTEQNQKMMVSTNGGFDIIDPVKKTIEHTGRKEGLTNDTVYSVLQDRKERTWFTGPSNGIDIIDSARTMILHTEHENGLNDDNIADALEDNDGAVWIAGYGGGGIGIIDPATTSIQLLNNLSGLRETSAKAMMKDQYGRIWIGTSKGLHIIDKQKQTVTTLTTKEGLPSDNILSILAYKNSVLVGTNRSNGLITPPPYNADSAGNKWIVEIQKGSELLKREQVNSWKVDAITEKGEYLWGDNGLVILNGIKPSNDSILTYITGFSLMNKPQYFKQPFVFSDKDSLTIGDSTYAKGQLPPDSGYASRKDLKWDNTTGPYNLPEKLTIPFTKNYMQFNFVQANSGLNGTPEYIYILEGIDKDWSKPTTNTFSENYLNLGPGDYTFKVTSKGYNGKWGTPVSFSFSISPPWYKTWWFYALVVIAAAALLRMYIVYRSRRLQRENKMLDEKVTLRTKQLQQSIEELKTTQSQLVQSEKMASLGELTAGIAHEIQNPLNFVNNFSDVNTELLAEVKEELSKGNLNEVSLLVDSLIENEKKINHHGKRADGIVRGMLQHSRKSTGEKEVTDINLLVDEYIRLCYHGLRAKDKSFNAKIETDLDPAAGKIAVIPQDLGRVVLNLLTNAFYAVDHKKKTGAAGQAGFQPSVHVSTKRTGDKVLIKIKDNGEGISQEVLGKIFQPFFTTKPTGQGTGLGLSLSYDIITKAHGGELNVETKEGEGTTFIIQLNAS